MPLVGQLSILVLEIFFGVKIHRHKKRSADRLFSLMKRKRKEDVTREDLVAVVFSPLMSGKMTRKERVIQGLRILNEEYEQISREDLKKMQSVLYVLASKFLTKGEMKEVKEGFFMNPLGQMIFDDGVVYGRSEGRARSVLDILQNRGSVGVSLSEKILAERDDAVLKKWLMLAVNSQSVQEFEAAMSSVNSNR